MAKDAIIVTGAASGIGKAIAEALAAAGLPLVLNDIAAHGAQTAQALERKGGRVLFVQGDVASDDDVAVLVQAARTEFGAVRGLVNNAGIVTSTPIGELARSEWERTLAVNLTGPFLLCRACLPLMKERGGGVIVNVASVAGQSGGILVNAAYAAAKGGLIALTKVIAREGAPHGIRCNAVAPGPIDTRPLAALGENVTETLAKKVPLGRVGSAEDVAHAVQFLLSDEAAFVTGATIDVNGGLVMR